MIFLLVCLGSGAAGPGENLSLHMQCSTREPSSEAEFVTVLLPNSLPMLGPFFTQELQLVHSTHVPEILLLGRLRAADANSYGGKQHLSIPSTLFVWQNSSLKMIPAEFL